METSRYRRSVRDASAAAAIAVAIELALMTDQAGDIERHDESLWQASSRMAATQNKSGNLSQKKWGVPSGWNNVPKR
jgi:hypothetical protein